MFKQINFTTFCDAFDYMGRKDQFSYSGLVLLYDYLIEHEESANPQELDVVALCCEFTEYSDIDDFHSDYDIADFPDMRSISDSTIVIQAPSNFLLSPYLAFIVQAF